MIDETQIQTFMEACFKRKAAPVIVLRPDKFKDDQSVAKRVGVIKALREEHQWPIRLIAEVCPLSERMIWWILR